MPASFDFSSLDGSPLPSAVIGPPEPGDARQGAGRVQWANAAWRRLPAVLLDYVLDPSRWNSIRSANVLTLNLRSKFDLPEDAPLAIQPLPDHANGRLLTLLLDVDKLASVASQSRRRGSLDNVKKQTLEDVLSAAGSHGKRILEHDWASTPVGPLDAWPESVKTTLISIVQSEHPSTLWLGFRGLEDPIFVGNEAYLCMLGGMNVFGVPGSVAFGDQWPALQRMYRDILRTGKADIKTSSTWEMPNDEGQVIERVFDYELLPIYEPDGTFTALLNRGLDVGAAIISRRRLETIHSINASVADCRTTEAYCTAFLRALDANAWDLPFALLYVAADEAEGRPGSPFLGAKERPGQQRGVSLALRGAIGIPDGSAAAPSLVQLRPTSSDGSAPDPGLLLPEAIVEADVLPWQLDQVMRERKSVRLDHLEDTIATFDRRGWPDPPIHALAQPLMSDSGSASGVLILGASSRATLDGPYLEWLEFLAQHISSGLNKIAAMEQSEMHAARVQELERMRGAFFSTINDELRTPISLILGPLGALLEREGLSSEIKRQLRIANRSALRLMSLTTTMLDHFRLQGSWSMTFQPVQLDLLTNDTINHLNAATESGVRLFEADCEPVHIWLDGEAYEKALLALVGGLLRERKVEDRTVRITLRPTEKGAVLVVGIRHLDRSDAPAEGPPASFDRLGFSKTVLVSLLEKLKATVEDSTTAKEHRFTVTFTTRDRSSLEGERVVETQEPLVLPATRYTYAAAAITEDSLPSEDSQSTTDTTSQLLTETTDATGTEGSANNVRGSTILLAAGSTEMRSYCRHPLAGLFKFIEAANTQDALDSILSIPPDLVIVDSDLPGHGAFALISSLRERELKIPVIMLSNRAGTESRMESILAGADELVVKPFAIKELLARSVVQLQLSKMRIELERGFEERTRALLESRAALDQLSDELKAVCDASTSGIFNLDSEGRVLYLNEKWYETTGAPKDMPLDNWGSYVDPADLAETYRIYKEAIDNASSCELTARWTSGKSTLVTMQPWYRADGTLRFTGCVVDVTEIRRLESMQIDAAKERAAEAERMRMMQEISVDVSSHELRNPLSSVTQAAELMSQNLDRIAALADKTLSENKINEEAYNVLMDELVGCDEMLETIKLCSMHQKRVADDVLSFSKLSMQLLTLNMRPLDVVELAEVTVKMLSSDLQRHSLRLTVTVDDSLVDNNARYVSADGHRLSQVLINFLVNAMRYSSEASNRVIEINLAASATLPSTRGGDMRVAPPGLAETTDGSVWTTISVRDYGRGLSEEERHQLFQRFAQVKPNTDGLSGFGLGLYISKSIVHLHGGFIELRSLARGAGSTFSFTVPVQRVAREACSAFAPQDAGFQATELSKRRPARTELRARRRRPGLAPSTSTPAVTPPLVSPSDPLGDKGHICIADDSTVNVRLLEMQLQRRGYRVSKGYNGQEALDIINKHRTSLLCALLDVEMPVMDGPGAVRELRKMEQAAGLPHLRCIAVTGNARDAQAAAILGAGFDDIVTKPYNIEQLCSVIEASRNQP